MSSLIVGASNASVSAGSSSDDDVQMLDSNGQVLPSCSSTTINAPIKNIDDINYNNEEDAGSEAVEDEYEIEYIVSHSQESTDGQLSYFVKWKGYPNSENSWVLESDMGGAQEMIQEYWAKVPKKRVKKMGTKGGKKAKRHSFISATTPAKTDSVSGAAKKTSRRESGLILNGETPSSSSRVRITSRKSASGTTAAGGGIAGELAPSRSPTPEDDELIDTHEDPTIQRIRTDSSLSEDQKALLESQHLHAIKIDRLRKRYARIADWDPIVRKVEAVEKMSDNKIRVFVHFQSGDRLAFDSVVAHHRCPLKLLQFYESHLRFKKREDGQEERVESLRGERDMEELDAYNAAVKADEVEESDKPNTNWNGDGDEDTNETQAKAKATAAAAAAEGENVNNSSSNMTEKSQELLRVEEHPIQVPTQQAIVEENGGEVLDKSLATIALHPITSSSDAAGGGGGQGEGSMEGGVEATVKRTTVVPIERDTITGGEEDSQAV